MPDIPPELQTALAARYELRRVLGRGGMATVYLADDRKHRRQVALKVLRPDLAASLGAERFLQEIQIAARLTHPHILALHDSGEAAGFLFYVMPFIDGPSLRARLEVEHRLDLADALAIASPVAEALSYAHRMGVFHRDIKPENILFSQGHPIVADFGIAKAISTAGQTNLTRTGFPLGTPGYMSPEQAAGLTDLDERTDVYSLAVVVYEMLVGEVPGRWPTEEAVRSGRCLEAPAAHRSRLAQAGSVVEGALVRGMAIRHEQRTASPEALIAELTGATAPRRRYSDDEVREIVKRASEIEAVEPDGGRRDDGGRGRGARGRGRASRPRRCARPRARCALPGPGAAVLREPVRANPWIGGPTRLAFERVVEGEVPESEFPTLVEEIRRVLNHPGQVSQLGRSFSWSSVRGVRPDPRARGGRVGACRPDADHRAGEPGEPDRRHLRRRGRWRGRRRPGARPAGGGRARWARGRRADHSPLARRRVPERAGHLPAHRAVARPRAAGAGGPPRRAGEGAGSRTARAASGAASASTTMDTRRIGSLEVSAVGLGCNNFGTRLDYFATAAVVETALEAGITFFDTADVYGAGRSEEFLGSVLAPHRARVVIATKFGMDMGGGRKGAKPAYVRRAVEDSLRRLKTDRIDLYQLHRPDPETPLEETLGVLDELVASGKVREIGCSYFTAEQLQAARAAAGHGAKFASVQNEFSLLNREPEHGVLEECGRQGLAFLPYYPLASGVLSGKYRPGAAAPPDTRLASNPDWARRFLTARNLAVADALGAFAAARGHTLLELAVSWLLSRPAVASVIAGASSPAQVEANAAAGAWRMAPEELAEIDTLTEGTT